MYSWVVVFCVVIFVSLDILFVVVLLIVWISSINFDICGVFGVWFG